MFRAATSSKRSKKEELQANEVMIHIDFSENWTVKTLSAVQSAHFGASLKQISLHTGMAYFGGTCTPNMAFCSMSDSGDHGPAAVWSHLLPVLINIRETDDNIDVLHVLSDGPTTQYRNRYNFFLASVIPSLLGFQRTFWNFSEAGHGKGPADGVGAAVKRLADRCVLSSEEVGNARSLCSALKPLTDIRLFLIDNFVSLSDTLNIPAFPDTMKIHQLMAEPSGRILYRRWSCYCSQRGMCRCVAYKTVHVGHVDKSCIHIPAACFQADQTEAQLVESITDNTQAIQFSVTDAAGYCTVWNGHGFQYVILTEVPFSEYLVTEPSVETVSTDVGQPVSDDVGVSERSEVPNDIVSDDLVMEPPVETVSTDVAQPVSDDVSSSGATVRVSSFYGRSSGTVLASSQLVIVLHVATLFAVMLHIFTWPLIVDFAPYYKF